MNLRHSWLLLLCVALPIPSPATPGKVRLAAKDPHVKIGKKCVVEVFVEGAPSFYGADVRLVFDPDKLEVVDQDKKTPGVQIRPGKLLDPKRSFSLQHDVDNAEGTVDYALTLMNPAPAVSGDGVLAEIVFLGRAEGSTTVSVAQGQFGTKTGEVLAPALEGLDLFVGSKTGGPRKATEPTGSAARSLANPAQEAVVATGSPARPGRFWLVSGALVLAAFTGGWFLARRRG
jgi:hypothetical protein